MYFTRTFSWRVRRAHYLDMIQQLIEFQQWFRNRSIIRQIATNDIIFGLPASSCSQYART